MPNCAIIICLVFGTVVDSFVTIRKFPSKGNNATIECTYPILNTNNVQWAKDTSGLLTSCQVPGVCLPFTNSRYSARVTTRASILTITNAKYEEDEGNWTCIVNNKINSTSVMTVATLPGTYDFEDPPRPGTIVTRTGLSLEARAVCVYPKPSTVKLRYKIRGDKTYNDVEKGTVDVYFAGGATENCPSHEFVMITKIKLAQDDFFDLTVFLMFQYTALSGEIITTRSAVDVVFVGHPCQCSPCQNGGSCKVHTSVKYECTCTEKFSGKNCEVPVYPCDSKPCKNGICTDTLAPFKYVCTCSTPYIGEHCEILPTTARPVSISSTYRVVVIGMAKTYLTVTKYPTIGNTGTLHCAFNQILPVSVQWSNVKDDNITVCSYPGYCLETTNTRYQAEVTERASIFTVFNADFLEDDGLWFCRVNSFVSSTKLTICSLPKFFKFDNPPVPGTYVSRNGLHLNATAICFYPKPTKVNFQYRIQGRNVFHTFVLRKPSVTFDNGPPVKCESHEFMMVIHMELFYNDFRDLNVITRFQYTALSGDSINTEDVVDLTFVGHPCELYPCKNNGKCKVVSSRNFTCSCPAVFTGPLCQHRKTDSTTEVITTATRGEPDSERKDDIPSNETPAIVGVVSVLVIGAVIVAVIVAVCNCKRKKSENGKGDGDEIDLIESNETRIDFCEGQQNSKSSSTSDHSNTHKQKNDDKSSQNQPDNNSNDQHSTVSKQKSTKFGSSSSEPQSTHLKDANDDISSKFSPDNDSEPPHTSMGQTDQHPSVPEQKSTKLGCSSNKPKSTYLKDAKDDKSSTILPDNSFKPPHTSIDPNDQHPMASEQQTTELDSSSSEPQYTPSKDVIDNKS